MEISAKNRNFGIQTKYYPKSKFKQKLKFSQTFDKIYKFWRKIENMAKNRNTKNK